MITIRLTKGGVNPLTSRASIYTGTPGPAGPNSLSSATTVGTIDVGATPDADTYFITEQLVSSVKRVKKQPFSSGGSDPNSLKTGVENNYYAPGLTASSTLGDGQTAHPSGSRFTPLTVKSVRLGQTPDWGITFGITDNPYGSIPDISVGLGWNPLSTAGYIRVMDACEHYYAPGAYKSIERYQTYAYPTVSGWWKGLSYDRRAFGVSTSDDPTLIGTGVPLAIVSNCDKSILYSENRRTIAEGGSGGINGQYWQMSQDINNGSCAMLLSSNTVGAENSLLVEMHQGGYLLLETSRTGGDIYFRPSSGGVMYLGGSGSNVRFQADGVGFFNGAAVTRQSAASAASDLSTVIALANSLRTGLINFNLFN